jgi:hypothetical protein
MGIMEKERAVEWGVFPVFAPGEGPVRVDHEIDVFFPEAGVFHNRGGKQGF